MSAFITNKDSIIKEMYKSIIQRDFIHGEKL